MGCENQIFDSGQGHLLWWNGLCLRSYPKRHPADCSSTHYKVKNSSTKRHLGLHFQKDDSLFFELYQVLTVLWQSALAKLLCIDLIKLNGYIYIYQLVADRIDEMQLVWRQNLGWARKGCPGVTLFSLHVHSQLAFRPGTWKLALTWICVKESLIIS